MPDLQTAPPPCSSDLSVALEYTSSQLESTRTNLEVIFKHVREYMVTQGEWVECVQATTQSALPQDKTTPMASSKSLGVPITETIASLLSAIFAHRSDLKGSSVNRVIKIWPAHWS